MEAGLLIMKLEILQEPSSVAARAAELMAEAMHQTDHVYNVALAGGSTPKLLYRMLAAEPWSDELPWDRIRWFFGDERFVPADHEDSNFRMARENLFTPAGIDDANVFRVRTELGDPTATAADYENLVQSNVPAGADGVPAFDLVLLGMGDDGHTASLFPQTAALDEKERLVVSNYVEKFSSWRITLTPPVLLAAREVILLVTGESKAPALAQVLEGEPNVPHYPSQLLRQRTAETTWLVDRAAAAQLA